jgi:hypothetical protein
MNKMALLIAGFYFILLGIVTALGSVSLGYYQITTSSVSGAGPYLVYNYFYLFLAVFFACCGGGILYLSGKERVKETKKGDGDVAEKEGKKEVLPS